MSSILVVDDQPYVRELLSQELDSEGFRVEGVTDAESVIEYLRNSKPDLVLLDLYLKGFKGWDVLHDIKSRHPHLPVILSTAYPAFKHDPKSIAADYYVLKTSNLEELKLKIRMALIKEIETLLPGVHQEIQEARLISSEQMRPH